MRKFHFNIYLYGELVINIKSTLTKMRHHIKIFKSEAEFRAYEASDDRWKPLVCFIPTKAVEDIGEINENTPGRVVFQRLGEKFFEVLNDGVGYFSDTADASAWIGPDGQIHISTTNPDDAKIVNGALKLTV